MALFPPHPKPMCNSFHGSSLCDRTVAACPASGRLWHPSGAATRLASFPPRLPQAPTHWRFVLTLKGLH